MVSRALEELILDKVWGRQMRFIAGPRQTGKTFIAKKILKDHKSSDLYFNWDESDFAIKYRLDPTILESAIQEHLTKNSWLCFDEIHKIKKWKNILKSHFDRYEGSIKTLVTGSAKLDLFRRSGDSLVGRYFLFHLYPLSISELDKSFNFIPNPIALDFIEERISRKLNLKARESNLDQLLTYSGFPEPFLSEEKRFQKKWQIANLERLLKEDLRELSMIRDIDQVLQLAAILPHCIKSSASISSFANLLQLNYATVKNYLKYLNLIYFIFELKPYSKKLSHMIQKEKKFYFYDWTRALDDSAQFENYVACEIKSMTSLWTDAGHGEFDLFYLKSRNQQETDFLITLDSKPWLMIEAKLNETNIDRHQYTFSNHLGSIPIVQIVRAPNTLIKKAPNAFVISAERFF